MLFRISTKSYLNTDYILSLIVNKIEPGNTLAVAVRLIDSSIVVLKQFETELDAVRYADNIYKQVNVHKTEIVKP